MQSVSRTVCYDTGNSQRLSYTIRKIILYRIHSRLNRKIIIQVITIKERGLIYSSQTRQCFLHTTAIKIRKDLSTRRIISIKSGRRICIIRRYIERLAQFNFYSLFVRYLSYRITQCVFLEIGSISARLWRNDSPLRQYFQTVFFLLNTIYFHVFLSIKLRTRQIKK